MPVAEAPRPRLRHLRKWDRHVQLREPAVVFGRRRAARGFRDDRATFSGRSSPSPAPWTRLLPIDHHARAYARKVKAMAEGNDHDHGNGDDRGRGNRGDKHQPAYRLYEVQNGNHIETYQDTFPQLELIQPHAQRAFDLLVDQVERGAALPPDQCIPRGGAISERACATGPLRKSLRALEARRTKLQ